MATDAQGWNNRSIIVAIVENGKAIWSYGAGGGMTSTRYAKDGKGKEIIAALETALFQARIEFLPFDNLHGKLEVGIRTIPIDHDMPRPV